MEISRNSNTGAILEHRLVNPIAPLCSPNAREKLAWEKERVAQCTAPFEVRLNPSVIPSEVEAATQPTWSARPGFQSLILRN
jgi:hypothetical protein